MSTLNDFRDNAYNNAVNHGFHEKDQSVGELLMLIVSELGEALEADRNDHWQASLVEKLKEKLNTSENQYKERFKLNIKDTVEDEIADALIRLFDFAGIFNIDLDFYVNAKMKYNSLREYKHGKTY